MDLSIVIPVYNSANILPLLINKVESQLNNKISFEVVLINDNSKDNSWDVIKQLNYKYQFLIGINLRKNAGQHNAIMAGLNYVNGDVIVMMDDDLQHDPIYIMNLFNKIKKDCFDVCYTKYKNRKHRKWKILGSKFNNLVASILIQKPKELYLSSFKAISKEIKNEILQYSTPYVYLDGMILSVTDNIASIEIEHKERLEGESNYTFLKLLSLWTQMATNFSVLPLRLATFTGIFISIVSFLVGIYYIVLKILGENFPEGWTTIIVIVLFFGGIILTSLGIIGEYIGRSYLKLNGKKQFVIKDVLNERV